MKSTIVNLLEKGQKYTKTDNVYLAKYGSLLTFGDIIAAGISFALSIAFAHYLPKETFGQYKYLLSLFGILAIASLPGMNSAVVQGVANGHEGVLKKAFKTKLKWSLIGSLAGLGMAVYFWLAGNHLFASSMVIIAFFLPFFNSAEIFQFYLDGKTLFSQRMVYTAIVHLFATLFMIASILITYRLDFLILSYFFGYSASRGFFLLYAIRKNPPNEKEDPAIIKYGKHLSLMNVLSVIAQYIDQVLLFIFLGPIQLAIYAFAIMPIQQIRAPFQHLQEIALPKLAVKNAGEIKKNLPALLVKSLVLVGAVMISYILLLPYFFQLFYPQYLEAVPYARVYALTLLIFPISMMTLSLQAKIRTKELYQINTMNSIIKISAMAILIPFYGIWGVVGAVLASQLIYSLIVWFYFKKM